MTDEKVSSIAQQNVAKYDKDGEQHYDIISAFIKSIRGSDPNAAIYWLARMVEGGEDPKFIARRLLISATEDIGLANPTGLNHGQQLLSSCYDNRLAGKQIDFSTMHHLFGFKRQRKCILYGHQSSTS